MIKITQFDLKPGTILADKYVVTRKLSVGTEGEVYLTSEIATGIERATKIFFPHKNQNNELAKNYATKMHHLRFCSGLVKYHSYELVKHKNCLVTCLISEYVDGHLLIDYLKLNNESLHYYQSLQIIYEIAKFLKEIHEKGNYHGNLHLGNVIIKHTGLSYHIKLIDCIDWGVAKKDYIKKDIYDLLRIYYAMLGSNSVYSSLPQSIKGLLFGLKKNKIYENYKNAEDLIKKIDKMNWTARQSFH